MTIQTVPFALQNASHAASVFRNASTAPWVESGPILPNEMWVAAQSTPNMSVQVGPGRAMVAGTQVSAPTLLPSGTALFTTQGMYTVLNDAPVSLTIAAADPTNPRIDVAYVAVQDSFYSGSNNQAVLGVVTGTPAPTPSVPAVPVNAVALGNVAVAANATSITNGNITNLTSPAVLSGSYVPVPTLAQLKTFTPLMPRTHATVYADSTGTNNGDYVFLGGVWLPVLPIVAVNTSGTQGGITTATTVTGLSVSITLGAATDLQIRVGLQTYGLSTDDVVQIDIMDGATNVGQITRQANSSPSATATSNYQNGEIHLLAVAAGTHTYTVQVTRVAGSGTLTVAPSTLAPSFLAVQVDA